MQCMSLLNIYNISMCVSALGRSFASFCAGTAHQRLQYRVWRNHWRSTRQRRSTTRLPRSSCASIVI